MRYRLENEPDASLHGWSFLHFRTPRPAIAFARLLNRLYDLHLWREEDMPLGNAEWPFFRYQDPSSSLQYFFVERPATCDAAVWAEGDKLLLIRGDLASTEVECLFDDLTDPPPAEEGDILQAEHLELVNLLLSDFTIPTVIDFSATAYESRRQQREKGQARQLCNLIIDYIESKHLDMTPEELLRLKGGSINSQL